MNEHVGLNGSNGEREEKMDIRVIATDMDGTLLDPKGQLDLPRLEKILDKLDQCDIRLSLQREMKFIVCDNYWNI